MSQGLEDVVAAQTVLSDVDGLAGRLVIRGLPLSALAGHYRYEDALALLWDGFFADLPADLTTPLAEAFQGIVWHALVSHPALKKNATKW